MFTKLKNQSENSNNESRSHHSQKSIKTNTNKKDKEDKEWIKGLAHTPIISKSLILPRYMQTKDELVQ